MSYFLFHIAILTGSFILIPFLNVKWKGLTTLFLILLNTIYFGTIGYWAITGEKMEVILRGTLVTEEIPIRIDALSGWFMLLINFTLVTGGLYGMQYMKAYRSQTANISLHCLAYILVQLSLTAICVVQNAFVFLLVWEVMTFSCFILIIFEYYKQDTLQAGINFFIQSHVGVLLLIVGFIWLYYRTGSYDFEAIREFSTQFPHIVSLGLFFCFFFGFAIKAGFVPFHTWLPYAHPASPSHVSGVMSGVIIKIGIFGILRMIQLIQTDFIVLGYFIIVFSVITGVYGVMLAIIQHNLKKLLAYHSIENIGIIGIGIGIGTLGIGQQNPVLIILGFGGGLLHVLNHSLFKSLLFYGTGNVYQETHTLNIEQFGGLVKKMPHNTLLFLIASLAICGLPPFNGFISEFLIYSGLLEGMENKVMQNILVFLFTIFGLVLIGGLAILCFTKAFGSIFLGKPRHAFQKKPDESNLAKLVPMYMIAILMVSIGLFPTFFFKLMLEPIHLFSDKIFVSAKTNTFIDITDTLQVVGFLSIGLVVLGTIVFLIRKALNNRALSMQGETWGCGYVGDTQKMQYSASSFIRNYRKLAEPVLSVKKNKIEVEGIFPNQGRHETHPHDKIEEWLIENPWKHLKLFFAHFRFLQNGNAQFYVLYGIVFIALVIGFPMIYNFIIKIIYFLNQI